MSMEDHNRFCHENRIKVRIAHGLEPPEAEVKEPTPDELLDEGFKEYMKKDVDDFKPKNKTELAKRMSKKDLVE